MEYHEPVLAEEYVPSVPYHRLKNDNQPASRRSSADQTSIILDNYLHAGSDKLREPAINEPSGPASGILSRDDGQAPTDHPAMVTENLSRDIFSETQKCMHLLQQCLNINILMEREWAENKLADFTLWASGIGAFIREKNKISLDSRLRERPALRDIFLRLLQMLLEFIQQCHTRSSITDLHNSLQSNPYWTAYHQRDESEGRRKRGRALNRDGQKGSRGSRSISPWSDQSSLDGEVGEIDEHHIHPLADAMKSVDITIDQLNNLSVAVRRTGNQLRLQKADSRFKRSEHSDLEKFLRVSLFAEPSEASTIAWTGESQLTPIQTRLVTANLRRRNRFLYAQGHSQKLTGRRESDRAILIQPGLHQDTILGTPFPIDNSTATMLGSTIEQIQLPVRTADKNSQISQITSTTSKIDYPFPPKIRDGVSAFKCPCCCQTLPRIVSQGNRWK